MDAVTPILVDRAREPEGLQKMVTISVAVHAVLTVAILFMPAPDTPAPEERDVMQISLGGPPGPRSGGMTSMGGRATVATPDPLPRRAPVPAPPAQAPEMVLPKPLARPPKPQPEPRARTAPRQPAARTPPPAAETQEGNAVAETGGPGVGFGLTTGGGGTSGYLDVANFCCPEYLSTMIQLIHRNWNSKQQVAGDTQVRYTIQRDGRLTDIEVEKSSGYFALDQTAQRALIVTRQLPPLPPRFTENSLTVHLIFRYER